MGWEIPGNPIPSKIFLIDFNSRRLWSSHFFLNFHPIVPGPFHASCNSSTWWSITTSRGPGDQKNAGNPDIQSTMSSRTSWIRRHIRTFFGFTKTNIWDLAIEIWDFTMETVGFHGDEGHTILSNSFKTWSLNNPILMVTQFFETNPLNSPFHVNLSEPGCSILYIYTYMFAILLLDAEMYLSWSIKGLSSHRP